MEEARTEEQWNRLEELYLEAQAAHGEAFQLDMYGKTSAIQLALQAGVELAGLEQAAFEAVNEAFSTAPEDESGQEDGPDSEELERIALQKLQELVDAANQAYSHVVAAGERDEAGWPDAPDEQV